MKKTHLTQNIRFVVFTLFILTFTFQALAQSKSIREVTMNSPFESPIEIKSMLSGSQRLRSGQEFNSGINWFSELEINLTPKTEKRITYIQLELMFLSHKKKEPPLVVPVNLGKREVNKGDTSGLFSKGNRVEINLKSKIPSLVNLVRTSGYSGNRMIIRISRVQYDNGTGWAHGRKTLQDTANPLLWHIVPSKNEIERRIEKISSTRNTYSPQQNNRQPSFMKTIYSKKLDNISLNKKTTCRSSFANSGRETCFKWKNYEFINCGCGMQITSDNFRVCSLFDDDCDYKPVNTPYTCISGTCTNIQYHLVTWWCGADEF